MEHTAAVREWARRFNAGDFFEAHEVLEADWLAAREPRKTLLKGLIHAAVALHHYRRGNGHGARVKYASCRRYLELRAGLSCAVDTVRLLAEMERFFAPLLRKQAGSPPPAAAAFPRAILVDAAPPSSDPAC